jgi:hypothetical protein
MAKRPTGPYVTPSVSDSTINAVVSRLEREFPGVPKEKIFCIADAVVEKQRPRRALPGFATSARVIEGPGNTWNPAIPLRHAPQAIRWDDSAEVKPAPEQSERWLMGAPLSRWTQKDAEKILKRFNENDPETLMYFEANRHELALLREVAIAAGLAFVGDCQVEDQATLNEIAFRVERFEPLLRAREKAEKSEHGKALLARIEAIGAELARLRVKTIGSLDESAIGAGESLLASAQGQYDALLALHGAPADLVQTWRGSQWIRGASNRVDVRLARLRAEDKQSGGFAEQDFLRELMKVRSKKLRFVKSIRSVFGHTPPQAYLTDSEGNLMGARSWPPHRKEEWERLEQIAEPGLRRIITGPNEVTGYFWSDCRLACNEPQNGKAGVPYLEGYKRAGCAAGYVIKGTPEPEPAEPIGRTLQEILEESQGKPFLGFV